MNNKVIEQYEKQSNLDIRVELHRRYSKNKIGFKNWIFSNYTFTYGIKVLELGCGTGELWKHNLESITHMGQLVISDFSKVMVETTKSLIGNRNNVMYKQMDIQNICFDDKYFDIVIANMMLHHVPDIQKSLCEVNHVLKKSGTFYCATFGENGVVDYLSKLCDDKINQKLENKTFTLQNGMSYLQNHFNNVEKLIYDDELQVTKLEFGAIYPIIKRDFRNRFVK